MVKSLVELLVLHELVHMFVPTTREPENVFRKSSVKAIKNSAQAIHQSFAVIIWVGGEVEINEGQYCHLSFMWNKIKLQALTLPSPFDIKKNMEPCSFWKKRKEMRGSKSHQKAVQLLYMYFFTLRIYFFLSPDEASLGKYLWNRVRFGQYAFVWKTILSQERKYVEIMGDFLQKELQMSHLRIKKTHNVATSGNRTEKVMSFRHSIYQSRVFRLSSYFYKNTYCIRT